MAVAAPEQMVCVAGETDATGFGFTVTSTSTGAPAQKLATGVMV